MEYFKLEGKLSTGETAIEAAVYVRDLGKEVATILSQENITHVEVYRFTERQFLEWMADRYNYPGEVKSRKMGLREGSNNHKKER